MATLNLLAPDWYVSWPLMLQAGSAMMECSVGCHSLNRLAALHYFIKGCAMPLLMNYTLLGCFRRPLLGDV
jgi:hypothetical protein